MIGNRICFYLTLRAKLIVLVFLWLFMSYLTVAQEDLQARVKQLEIQVQQLTDELLYLRKALRAQEKLSEKLVQNRENRQDLLYDDVIASYQEQQQDNLLFSFYRRLIHSHIWLGGYLSLNVEKRESVSEQSILDLSSFAVAMRSSLHERISICGEIHFSIPQEWQISHAYVVCSLNSLLNFKAGVVRIPFGRYNSTYAPPGEQLVSIPDVNNYIIPTIWSEPGISLFGNYNSLPWFTLNYEFLVSKGLGENGFNVESGNRDARQNLHRDNNNDVQWTTRIEIIPEFGIDVVGFAVAVSGVIGQYAARQDNQFLGGAIDGLLNLGYFTLIGDHDRIMVLGEYAHMYIERDFLTRQQFPETVPRMWGYYIELQYQFFPEVWRYKAIFFDDESSFALTFRYEHTDLDTRYRGASQLDDRRIYTLGVNFRPIRESVFKIEYSWIYEHLHQWSWNNRLLLSFATYF